VRCRIGKNVRLKNVIVMGNDYYPMNAEDRENHSTPILGIGDNSVIEETIIDKNCKIGQNVVIRNTNNVQLTLEQPFGMIRDGVVCISKHIVLPDHWSLDKAIE